MRQLTCQPGRVESSYLGSNPLQGSIKVLLKTRSLTPSRMWRRDAPLREVLIHSVASHSRLLLQRCVACVVENEAPCVHLQQAPTTNSLTFAAVTVSLSLSHVTRARPARKKKIRKPYYEISVLSFTSFTRSP
jgi:hypothetical protein